MFQPQSLTFFMKAHYYSLNKISVMLFYAQQEICSSFLLRIFLKDGLQFLSPYILHKSS